MLRIWQKLPKMRLGHLESKMVVVWVFVNVKSVDRNELMVHPHTVFLAYSALNCINVCYYIEGVCCFIVVRLFQNYDRCAALI